MPLYDVYLLMFLVFPKQLMIVDIHICQILVFNIAMHIHTDKQPGKSVFLTPSKNVEMTAVIYSVD